MGPSSAQSVEIIVRRQGAADFKFQVNRREAPAGYTETVTAGQSFPVGRMDVTYRFHAGRDAGGEEVAVAYAAGTMTSKGEGLDTVTTEGKVVSVEIPEGQSLNIGQTGQLAVLPRNAEGEVMALSPGSFFWSTEDSGVLALQNDGARGVTRGSASVRVTVDGKASEPQTVQVTNQPSLVAVGSASSLTFDCLISADGTTVFGRRETSAGERCFVWKPGSSIVSVPPQAGFSDFIPHAISADGTVVVGSSTNADGVNRATVWTGPGAGTFTTLGTLTGDAGEQSNATGVSADGSVIVGVSDSLIGPQAFRWTSAGMVGLGDFSTPDDEMSFSRATGVSADGQVVIGQARLGDALMRGFVWTSGAGMREIGAVVTPDSETVEVKPRVITQSGGAVYGTADEVPWKWQASGISRALDAGRFVPTGAGEGVVFGTSTEVPAAMWTEQEGVKSLVLAVSQLGLNGSLGGYRIVGVAGCSAAGDKVLLLGGKPDGDRATFILTLP